MFILTDVNDYGHSEIVDTFDTAADAEAAISLLEAHLAADAEAAISLLEAHLDDGPSYRLRDAINQFREQLEAYYQAD